MPQLIGFKTTSIHHPQRVSHIATCPEASCELYRPKHVPQPSSLTSHCPGEAMHRLIHEAKTQHICFRILSQNCVQNLCTRCTLLFFLATYTSLVTSTHKVDCHSRSVMAFVANYTSLVTSTHKVDCKSRCGRNRATCVDRSSVVGHTVSMIQ